MLIKKYEAQRSTRREHNGAAEKGCPSSHPPTPRRRGPQGNSNVARGRSCVAVGGARTGSGPRKRIGVLLSARQGDREYEGPLPAFARRSRCTAGASAATSGSEANQI